MERSFSKQIDLLRLGAGDTFRGEGILAITKALLQSGVSYVGGYQGAPISHLLDVLSDAQPLLEELGVHFEHSSNEAAAAAMCAASVNYNMRGAVAWKSNVGTNVACDALSNIASVGVKGGVVVILGEDYGEGASIVQERSHAFAMKSQIWLMDPRPNHPKMVEMVERAFELSEASNTPVMVEFRIRACHVTGSFECKDNVASKISLKNPLKEPEIDYERVVLPPSTFKQEQKKVAHRMPAAIKYIQDHKLNEVFEGKNPDLGIVMLGGLYNSVQRGLHQLGLGDGFGATDIPLYVLNVSYPLIDDELETFCRGKKSILVIEEGQPSYHEDAIRSILAKRKIDVNVTGKEHFSVAGEYTREVLLKGLSSFFTASAANRKPAVPPKESMAIPMLKQKAQEVLAGPIPPRPPGFCTGCPERPVFSALKIIQQEMGDLHIAADIGCHSNCTLPPFNMGSTMVGYGLGLSSAAAISPVFGKRTVSIMGDGGFWHSGLSSGFGSALFNQTDSVVIIMANGYSSATGQQHLPSTGTNHLGAQMTTNLRDTLKGMGVSWVKTAHPYDVAATVKLITEALNAEGQGLRVIISEAECQLAFQRREKPKVRKKLASGERVATDRFGIDADICTGDRECVRLSGCPSMSVRDRNDPLWDEPVTYIDDTCVGCGLCGELVAEKGLCPSFYRTRVIENPTGFERFVSGVRSKVISRLMIKQKPKSGQERVAQ